MQPFEFSQGKQMLRKGPTTISPVFEHPIDQNLLPVFMKLMAPLEFLLFCTNMLFLAYFYLERDHLGMTKDIDHLHALETMAMIDQLLLFFFAMKLCLKFGTKLNEILFEDEIRNANQHQLN